MKKQRVFSKRSLKTVVAVAIAAALAVPVTTSIKPVIADETAVATVVPERLLDFNEGLKEYYTDEALKLDIVKTEDVYVCKTKEELEATDRVDANNILIMGNGSGTYYKKYTISNQPSTYVDEERGTVLYMGKTVHLDAVKKEKSAGLDDDADGTKKLDEALPVPEGDDKTIQDEMTIRSELNFNNPISDSTSKFTVSMWIKIPTADGVTNELAGAWHYVAVTADGDNAAYYVDGEVKEDANVIEKIKAWVASGDKLSIGGDTDSAKAFADAFGITDANAAIMIDDLGFYKEAVSAEQIKSEYEDSKKEVTPVANKIDVNSFSDITNLKDAEYPAVSRATESVSVSKATVNGKEEDVVNIDMNKKPSTSTGAYISNPFSGKELDGATISFWTKQDKRGTTGDGTETTPLFSFLDTTKLVSHEKSESKGDAWSILSAQSDGTAVFKEAFSNDSVCNKLKNSYVYSISTEDRENFNVTDWYNVTIVMNNGGIKMYINGVLYDNATLDANGKSIAAGTRFCDGYFQRADDEKDMKTKYNIFGGSNNQYATSLMDFITYDDITLFLGYRPNTGTLNVKTNPTSFASIRTFDTDLTAEQVKALYADSTAFDNNGGNETPKPSQTPSNETPKPSQTPNGSNTPSPSPSGETLLGDADLDGEVKLADALLVLKTALGIENLDGQAATNADANKDGKISLEDASLILKAALGIVKL